MWHCRGLWGDQLLVGLHPVDEVAYTIAVAVFRRRSRVVARGSERRSLNLNRSSGASTRLKCDLDEMFFPASKEAALARISLRMRGGREFTVSRTYKKNLQLLAQLWFGMEGVAAG